MKTNWKLTILVMVFIWTATSVVAQKTSETHKDSLNTIVEKYYDLNLKIFQANSTVQDIDKVFDLFTEDFTYVHPQYGGTYTREDLYSGYVRNQENGGYNGTITDIIILNKIIGLNAVAVQKGYVKEKDGKIEGGEAEMTLFEFKDGKISRIFEYW